MLVMAQCGTLSSGTNGNYCRYSVVDLAFYQSGIALFIEFVVFDRCDQRSHGACQYVHLFSAFLKIIVVDWLKSKYFCAHFCISSALRELMASS